MKAGWVAKSLGEVLLKTETFNPAITPDKEFDYIDVSSVSNESYEVEETQRLKGRDAPSRARRLVKTGDVIFATIRPTLKRIARVPVELDGQICSTGYFVMRPSAEIDEQYLFYSLFTDEFMSSMEALQKGASYPAVTDAEVRAQRLRYPPRPEQRRIVTLLDEAFADIATAKANAEKNLQNARELANELSAQILSAPSANCTIQSLEEIVEADCSLSYGIVQPGDEFESGLPIVRPVNLDRPLIELGGLKRIDPTLAKGYERTKLKGGEVLLCVRGTTGTLSCASSALAGANVTRGIVPIRFNPQSVSQELGYFLMRSAPVQAQIRAKTYGTALMQINIRDLRQIQIPVPHPSQQAAIAKALQDAEEQTNRLTEIQGQKLTALDDLKKSLLHHAFSGQLSQ
ncbi:restriction endonuclease subunit S [Limnohabitans sp. JirII-31]|uniref:restriction endonuclease subunit S n=1 Tax=Limnohabitans sp. JirII-31 TaxID=1977908 RepID=UPI000C1E557A|nr:restriction endonuclease subunit S [Limnohabitans sp. JirII-31]PIT80785.1 hypothetical protein B9Z41_02455 [Limnohabitans sp. JirII-31]